MDLVGKGAFVVFMLLTCRSRVARWYIFKPKIPFWENFGGTWNGKG
jgi:hypothetical protein